jgi:hypothetical protein
MPGGCGRRSHARDIIRFLSDIIGNPDWTVVRMTKDINRRRRPFGLYMIIGLQLAIALILGTSLVLIYLVLGGDFIQLEQASTLVEAVVKNPFYFSGAGWVLVAALLLADIGLLIQMRWGWTLTMILTGFGLAYNIWSYFQGNSYYIVMAVYIIMVFYLNQRDVQSSFMDRSRAGESP